jgi:hypothetical protein
LEEPHRPLFIECYCLEEGAARTEGARRVRDDNNAFGTEPVEDSQSSVAAGVDCVDRTGRATIGELLIAHPQLAAKGPEVTRHYSWIFNLMSTCELPDRHDSCQSVAVVQAAVPLNLPHVGAKFTRHEHVEVKCAFMVERNAGMVR